MEDLCHLLPLALANSSPLPNEADSVSKVLGSLKAVMLQAKQVSLRMAATHCITALVCTPAAPLCAQLHLPDDCVFESGDEASDGSSDSGESGDD
ncbi:hypothetical protein HPB52_025664 [Rhipicephalus sanguineus]|uniref:Uncharacterized protein n=1 Tax=Rhipicephalus sanguineus TaxID=34632 RepID=A0A9D4TCN2_RHISA|nr:hypothetical protein HPB52_025664 [Rhipicephalus sanguineus]